MVGPALNLAFSGIFAPSGGTYDLINDPGIGVNWTGAVMVDIAQYLIDNGVELAVGTDPGNPDTDGDT